MEWWVCSAGPCCEPQERVEGKRKRFVLFGCLVSSRHVVRSLLLCPPSSFSFSGDAAGKKADEEDDDEVPVRVKSYTTGLTAARASLPLRIDSEQRLGGDDGFERGFKLPSAKGGFRATLEPGTCLCSHPVDVSL